MIAGLALSTTPIRGTVRIPVRVIPRSPRTTVGGVRDGRLLIRVTAPPVDRAANVAAIAALAEVLGLPPRSLSIAAGATSRNKVVEVQGSTAAKVVAALQTRGHASA